MPRASDITKRKKGGQPGNKNAVGHKGGPPPGSKNGFKHGAYERVMVELLSEDEAEVFQDEETGANVEAELRRTLASLNAKEIRLMKHINRFTSTAKGGQIVQGVDKTTTETQSGTFTKDERGRPVRLAEGETFTVIRESTTTHTTTVLDALSRLEAELDRVQARKIKILSKLEDIKIQRERLELERKRLEGENETGKLVQAWIQALTGEKVEGDDGANETD